MTGLLFDRETGRIFDESTTSNSVAGGDASSTIIACVRQICLAYKKIKVDCTPKRVQQALSAFTEIEQSFKTFQLSAEDLGDFCRVSFVLWNDLVGSVELSECIPKHGPGATAEGVSGNQKFQWQLWHDRLESYFPLIDSGFPLGIPEEDEELEKVTIVRRESEQPVRVVTVPKTLKSPRVIAIEPCCMQFVQQGIRDVLYDRLEHYWLTRGHINFRDQTVNQQLAIESSRSGRLATIDLSEASDRVPRFLAMEMFRYNSDLFEAIDACRSTRAELPDGTVIGPLEKFASMGSALCFPVEAMYFYTICVVASLRVADLPVTPANIFEVSRDLYVYGDDILVPATNANFVLDYLRKYNCKVNADKTFVSGSFRESCGTDAYNGAEVTPTYLRTLCPENKLQADRLVSWVKTANLFYKKGYWQTAQFMFDKCEQILGVLPYVSETSPALGRISFSGARSISRWNDALHHFEIRGWVPSPVVRTDHLSGYGALFKSFSHLSRREGESQVVDPLHLERSARHGAVTLKRRWVPSLF
jgi:hypothetical protein